MGKSLTEMASEIVAAQASHSVMAADEMVAALKKTFDALKNIKTIEEGGPEVDAPPVDPRKSIQRNYIINLEDGKKYKQLTTRTLAKYGLTPAEYRKKWGFSARQPLASKALSAKRRKTALHSVEPIDGPLLRFGDAMHRFFEHGNFLTYFIDTPHEALQTIVSRFAHCSVPD